MDNSIEINNLEQKCIRTEKGLPEDIFLFISRQVPIINVDLLIKDEYNNTLLAWRDDVHCGSGWHVPGGIIRFKETIHERINKTALEEIGTTFSIKPSFLTVKEFIEDQKERSHFISLVYLCFLPMSYKLPFKESGYLEWHGKCPSNMIRIHECYREIIDNK